MPEHVFLVDAVLHRGDMRVLLRSIENHLSGFPGARAVWLTRPDQALFIDAQHVLGQTTDSSYESIITKWIDDASRNGAAGSVFHVLSYNTKVLARTAALNDALRIVTTDHLANIGDGGYGSRFNWSRSVPTVASGLSADEAVELAKRALRNGRHTSSASALHQPRLRLEMTQLDPRARRVQGDPTTWKLIPDLVERGQREGWLRQERRGPAGNEFVWLVEDSAGDPETAQPMLEAKAPAPASTEPLREPSPPKRREIVMEEVLRAERIGSPPIPRKHVFDAAEAVIKENNESALTVAALIGRVFPRAQQGAIEAGYMKEQRWSAICECVFRAMLQAKVLLMADGSPVPAKIGQHSSRVAVLADNFRQRTEALMAERIIQRLGDVKLSETYSLGLALYQQGRENAVSRDDLLARVDALLLLLKEDKRIDVNSDDVLVSVLE